MFLIFYSARKGYDDRVHHGHGGRLGKSEGPPRSVAASNCWQAGRQRRIDRAQSPAGFL